MKQSMSFIIRHRVAAIAVVSALAGAGCAAGVTYAAQPHMQNALGALQNARNELQNAAADKGGHRISAMRLIDQAIAEVRAGIAAGA